MSDNFLPNLFLLGAAKCATTTLHTILGSMPEVCMSNPKEPFFFECEYEKGLEFYRKKYFSHWNNEGIIGESRHRNLYLPYVPRRIYKLNPYARLLIVIRNPIDRAYSHWWYWYCRDMEDLSFADAVKADFDRISSGLDLHTVDEREKYCRTLDALGKGMYRTYLDSGYYYEQIMRYMQYFPESQIKVLLFEDLTTRPKQTIEEIGRFLGCDFHLDSEVGPDLPESRLKLKATRIYYRICKLFGKQRILPLKHIGKKIIATFQTAPSREIDVETRKWLQGHYSVHNDDLAHLLKRDLSHWK